MNVTSVDPAEKPPVGAAQPFRVMVVDDSAVIRGLFTRTLENDPEIAVVASVSNGQMALAALARSDVDVIVLDIEMPVMDGLTALPKLIAAVPDVKVIMASTLTLKNAQVSLKALSAGAADYVSKPSSTSELHSAEDFKRELLEKVKALAVARRSSGRYARRVEDSGDLPFKAPAARAPTSPKIVLRSPSKTVPSILAVGSSTGGPQALVSLLSALPDSVRIPIVVTQHMPPTFTTILAEHLGRAARRPSAEGADGAVIKPGHIYLAPGDFHMRIEGQGTDRVIRLSKDKQENFCRPSVDPMLRSLAAIYGPAVLTVILTGMGADGRDGGGVIAGAGGTVIAQDEKSSVVWGMPGAAAMAGICSAVLPLSDIAPYIVRMTARGIS